jgi:hypothetical protein
LCIYRMCVSCVCMYCYDAMRIIRMVWVWGMRINCACVSVRVYMHSMGNYADHMRTGLAYIRTHICINELEMNMGGVDNMDGYIRYARCNMPDAIYHILSAIYYVQYTICYIPHIPSSPIICTIPSGFVIIHDSIGLNRVT